MSARAPSRAAVARAFPQLDPANPEAAVIERLRAGSLVVGRCWLWQGYTRNGYPTLSVGGRHVYGHRLACQLAHGIPAGMETRHLGLEVPPPAPIALRWLPGGGCIEVPVAEAVEDEDLVLTPDMPTIEEVASMVVSMVHEAERRYPGPLSWRRWRLTGRVSSLLYTSGVTRSGGSAGMDGRDPIGGWIYSLPRWRDVLPRRDGQLRPYVLGVRSWWWESTIERCRSRLSLRGFGRRWIALVRSQRTGRS